MFEPESDESDNEEEPGANFIYSESEWRLVHANEFGGGTQYGNTYILRHTVSPLRGLHFIVTNYYILLIALFTSG